MKLSPFTVLTLTSLIACGAFAAQIPVVNPSFELPGTGKIKGWNGENGANIPGWASDTAAIDSGVESDWPGHTDGVWSGFLMAGDPSVWQLTGHVIQPTDLFTLQVDGRDNWSSAGSASLLMTLYYDNGGTRVSAANETKSLNGTWAGQTLTFNASALPASWGKNIGIELLNATTGDSWLGLDNIRLSVVPEPSSVALLGLGLMALALRRRQS